MTSSWCGQYTFIWIRFRQVRVEQVEADASLLGGQVELDRDRHQPELDRPPPHRSRHVRAVLPCDSVPPARAGPVRTGRVHRGSKYPIRNHPYYADGP